MSHQLGTIKLTGTIGNTNYYFDRQNGYLARQKSSLNKERVLSDPAFRRTRENAGDFGTASRASGLFRKAFSTLLRKMPGRDIHAVLIREFMKVVKSDQSHAKGSGQVTDGDLSLLRQLELNKHSEAKVYVPYTVHISRGKGEAGIEFADFIPQNYVRGVPGSTQFKFVSAVAEIDFERNSYRVDSCESGIIAIGQQTEASIHLKHVLSPDSRFPLFIVLGAEFHYGTDGKPDAVRNGIADWYKIVEVELSSIGIQHPG